MTSQPPPENPRSPGDNPNAPARPAPASDVSKAGPLALEGVAELAHELGSMLDGSLRMLGLALRTLGRANPTHAEQSDRNLTEAHRQVETASFALQRMADLVHAAMQGATLPLGSPALTNTRPVTLAEAAEHAVRVLTPDAQRIGATIRADIAPAAADQPAGPLYSVLLNGLRNALESLAESNIGADPRRGGTVELAATCEAPPPGHRVRWICITVTDDGLGPPTGPDAHRLFEHGFTTKSGGHGLGLALSRSIVRDLHGTIQLMPRLSGATPRGGAILRIAIPAITGEPWKTPVSDAGNAQPEAHE